MTEDQIKELIKSNLVAEGVVLDKLAEIGFNAGMEHVGKLSVTPWNKKRVTITLTAGVSEYQIGVDILTDYTNCKGIVELWHTDTARYPIALRAVSQFNRYARGETTTGRPFIGTIRGNDKILEVYYIPDANYTIWAYIRFILNFNDIPLEENEIIAWAGLMAVAPGTSGGYAKAVAMYSRCLSEIAVDSPLLWDGNRYMPELIVGNDGDSGKKSDSRNYWGLG